MNDFGAVQGGTGHGRGDALGARMGMWLFLFSELILFGGLFILYAVYLHKFHPEFVRGSRELRRVAGAVNTVFLLTSSLTMALSIAAIKRGDRRLSVGMLWSTIAFAIAFFVVKYFEWTEKFHHGLGPGSATLAEEGHGFSIFFGLYFVMTGLHGLHVFVGVATLAAMLALLARGRINREENVMLENAGLYWHLVDLIWIFLFPLFYLVT